MVVNVIVGPLAELRRAIEDVVEWEVGFAKDWIDADLLGEYDYDRRQSYRRTTALCELERALDAVEREIAQCSSNS